MSSLSKIRVLLAAPAGIMGSSLRSFLGAMSDIELVASVDLADGVINALAQRQPDILLLDADLIDRHPTAGLELFLDGVHNVDSNIATIVLVGNFSQQQAALKAKSTHVLLKGGLGEQLSSALESCANMIG